MTQTPASDPPPTAKTGSPQSSGPASGSSSSGKAGASSNPSTSGAAGKPGSTPPAAEPKKSARQAKAEQKAGDPLRGSRASGFYASVAALGVVLILLIIFIAQNTQPATVNYLGWSGQVSVAVALLIAAAAGLFLALLASSLRILQLRRRVKRERKAAA